LKSINESTNLNNNNNNNNDQLLNNNSIEFNQTEKTPSSLSIMNSDNIKEITFYNESQLKINQHQRATSLDNINTATTQNNNFKLEELGSESELSRMHDIERYESMNNIIRNKEIEASSKLSICTIGTSEENKSFESNNHFFNLT
jgi:hypothetical protein